MCLSHFQTPTEKKHSNHQCWARSARGQAQLADIDWLGQATNTHTNMHARTHTSCPHLFFSTDSGRTSTNRSARGRKQPGSEGTVRVCVCTCDMIRLTACRKLKAALTHSYPGPSGCAESPQAARRKKTTLRKRWWMTKSLEYSSYCRRQTCIHKHTSAHSDHRMRSSLVTIAECHSICCWPVFCWYHRTIVTKRWCVFFLSPSGLCYKIHPWHTHWVKDLGEALTAERTGGLSWSHAHTASADYWASCVRTCHVMLLCMIESVRSVAECVHVCVCVFVLYMWGKVKRQWSGGGQAMLPGIESRPTPSPTADSFKDMGQ